jgi:hypothetical protein
MNYELATFELERLQNGSIVLRRILQVFHEQLLKV